MRVDRAGPQPDPRRPLLAGSTTWLVSPWFAFLVIGVVTGLAIDAAVADPRQISFVAVLPLVPSSVLAALLVGGIWWRVARHEPWWRIDRGSLSVKGAMLGGLTAASLGVWALGDSPRYFLDASMPGMFVGLAIVRVGCLCAGCCAGRPSDSRWALWSYSVGHGQKRIATQPLESVACLVIAVGALALQDRAAGTGAVFLAAIAAYALSRQVSVPLREEQHESPIARPVIVGASGIGLVGAFALIISG